MHGLALHRERVIRALLGLVVVHEGGFQRVRQEAPLHRRQDVRQVLEAALVGPLARHLEVEHVAVHHVGRRAGVERGHGLRDHFLRRVARQLHLHAGLLLEFFDQLIDRLVLGRVEPLGEVDHQGLLRRRCKRDSHRERRQHGGRKHLPHGSPPLRSTCMITDGFYFWAFFQASNSVLVSALGG